MMTRTQHAATRARQRAIPPFVEFLLDEFGERIYDGRGGIRVFFTQKSIRRMEHSFGRRPVAKMSEYLGVYKVDDSRDGMTITIGHRSQRMKRR
ncbi:MAG: hypothetical protein JJE04_25420 [Acidobacteriia bacterium]|nr:hypothetical protein [Terriglobia bacterium]